MDIDLALQEAVEHHRAGRLGEAIAGYHALLAADPDNVAALVNLGAALRAKGEAEAAVAALARAVQLMPGFAGAHLNLGLVLDDTGDVEGASQAFANAARLDAGSVDAHLNWADALARHGDDIGAIAVYQDGLKRAPEDPRLLANLANSMLNLGDAAGAVEMLERATAHAPDDATIKRNYANALRLAGQPGRAAAVLDDLLADRPDDVEALCLRAFANFACADFAAAWPDYRWRWHSAHHEARRPFHQPDWIGEDLTGKTLLVCGEQAVGDELMFATMLGEVVARAGRVIVETEHRLERLFRRTFPGSQVVARRDPPDPRLATTTIDFQIAIGDLGGLMRTEHAAFAAGRPYLAADPARAEDFRQRYDALAGGRPRIGISWRSAVEHAGGARSLDAAAFAQLASSLDGWLVSLQYGDVGADLGRLAAAGATLPHVDDTLDPMTDLDGLAAQMAGLDLIVTVANTNLHLAGALGRPTLSLLAETPDWRWGTAGEQCLWYPSVTLLRQQIAGDWSGVMSEAAARAAMLTGVRSC